MTEEKTVYFNARYDITLLTGKMEKRLVQETKTVIITITYTEPKMP